MAWDLPVIYAGEWESLRKRKFRGAQAASLQSSGACRRFLQRAVRILRNERSMSFSASCRKEQAGSLCSQKQNALALAMEHD
jgi:hypothetical protein